MEDRYLFKGKRTDNGEWVIGYYGVIGERNVIIEKYAENYYCPDICESRHGNQIHEVNSKTICQCTGLKDKNGKLIWENEIIKCKFGIAVAVWDKSEWRIKLVKDNIWRKDLHYWVVEDNQRTEVVGNIFDNPELLEV